MSAPSLMVLAASMAAGPPSVDELIDIALSVYGPIDAVRVRALAEIEPIEWKEASIASDGRFGVITYPDGRRHDPSYFSYFDGETLYQIRSDGYYYTSWGGHNPRIWSLQQANAPWPMIATWIRAILDAPDRDLRLSEDELIVASPSLGLSLTFDVHNLALRSLSMGNSTHDWSRFDWRTSPPLPGEWTWTVHIDHPRVPNLRPIRYVIETIDVNPDDAEQSLAFDPVSMGVNRIDTVTGDVYSPDGEWIENLHAYARAVLPGHLPENPAVGDPVPPPGTGRTGARAIGPWLIGAGVLGLVAAAGIALRRRARAG